MNRSILKKNGIVLVFFIILVIIFNWSIFTGKNLMKWDIMDAYYPLSMFSADMLRSGKLPIWNAALQFGSPAYVMLGVPYWYPTTLFFGLTTGYSLQCVAWDYCTHVVLACFGMFLLTKSHLKETNTAKAYIVALIAGTFYGFSGLFISNAEHIMIVASAAWLPYVLFFVKKYLESGAKIFLMTASFCMGLSILGGYPEVWVATFIILVPYFLIHTKKENRLWVKVLKAAFTYIIFGIGTALAAAISLLPFIFSSQYIERLNGGVTVESYNVSTVLSAILPHYTEFAEDFGDTLDVSMISLFMGLITIILFLVSFFTKINHKWKYMLIICFTFLMMLGNNAFLHPLFYKYFPFFSSLRFPSTWRCVLTVFVLLLAAAALEDIITSEKKTKILTVICFGACVLFYVLYKVSFRVSMNLPELAADAVRHDLKMDTIVLFVYAVICAAMVLVKKIKRISKINIVWILVIGVVFDIFTGLQFLYPLTVTLGNENNPEFAAVVQETFKNDKNRTHSIDYSTAKRTKNSINSTAIVLKHTLDEDGYLSVLLDYVQTYKKSRHCRMSSDVPEIYMTNDAVSGSEVDYNDWLRDKTVSPYQIYVEQKADLSEQEGEFEHALDIKQFISGNIRLNVSQNAGGYLVVQQSWYPGWNVYVDGNKQEIEKINGTFLGVFLEEGEHEVEFLFRPAEFYAGAAITLGYLAACIVVFVIYLKNKKRMDREKVV